MEFRKLHEYKFDFAVSLLRIPIHVLLLILVWVTVFDISQVDQMAGMPVSVFVMYIIVARLVSYCQKPWDVYDLLFEYIRKGTVSLFLVRPVRFSLLFFFRVMSSAFFQLAIVYVVLAMGNLARLAGLQYHFPSLLYFGLFMVSTIMAVVLGFVMYYCISLAMFWVGDVWSVWGIWDGIVLLFSGEVIPITITPGFYAVASVLPFRHLVFTPVFIFLERVSITEALVQMSVQLGWILAFAWLANVILRKGLRKTAVQGG